MRRDELLRPGLADFAARLASADATPGGGCAAALSGALAASLTAMVARATSGNEKFADRAGRMDDLVAEADRLRGELLALVDADAGAFDQVMAAFRLPKETPEQQAERSEAIQAGYRTATEPPTAVCERAVRILELAAEVAADGNPNAVSDAGVAALLASAALDGAALNVRINLGAIRDEGFRSGLERRVDAAQSDGRELRARALAAVDAQLG